MWLLGAGATGLWGAQTSDEAADVQRFRFSATAHAVHLNVSVVDKKGKLVTNLERQDLRFWRTITFKRLLISPETNRRPSTSCSSWMRAAAWTSRRRPPTPATPRSSSFTAWTGRPSLGIRLRPRPVYSVRFLAQQGRIHRGLDQARAVRLHRALRCGRDVVDSGRPRRVRTQGHRSGHRRSRHLVVGIDPRSGQQAATVDLPVYAIRVVSPVDDPGSDLFLGVHGASFRGQDALRRFATDTGGAMYEGSRWSQLVAASARIREELKTQYRIVYVPQIESERGGFRRIHVQTRRRGIEARTRRGYFPKKSSSLVRPRPASLFTQ